MGSAGETSRSGAAGRRRVRTFRAGALSCALVLAACSGEPAGPADRQAAPDRSGTIDAGNPVATDAAAEGESGSGEHPSRDEDSHSSPATHAPRGSGEGSLGSTPTGGGAADGATATASAKAEATNRPPVPRFDAADERVGITDATIKLCTHVNGQSAAAIGATFEDARVVWRWVNDQGGVHGRKIDMVIADDGDGATVAAAYEECRGSFFITGGPTQEAVPSFREVVEQDPHPAPYLHFMARADASKKYSFSWYPTQERNGILTARFILARYPGKRIGVIRRDSDNWGPGYHAFVAELKRNGVTPVATVAHPPKEQFYEPYLAELAAKKAEVVWAWNHAVEHIPMLKQSTTRTYGFQWVLGFPVSVVSETLRDDLLAPKVVGLNVFPTFRPGLYDEHHKAYEQEGKLFEQAYQKYRGRPADPMFSDLLLRQWLDGRQTAKLLETCGRDCTRTKLVTALVNHLDHWTPSCPFDFSLGRAAGAVVSAVEAYRASATTVAWRETAHCVSSF